MHVRSVVAAVVAGVAALTAALVPMSPAYADDALKCTAFQQKYIANGSGSVTVSLQLCVERYNGNVRRAGFRLIEVQTRDFTNPANVVYYLHAFVRLEHHQNRVTHRGCNSDDGYWNYYANYRGIHLLGTCSSPAHTGGSSGGWTADGVISYDVKGDGLGKIQWPLSGTQAIN